MNGLMMHCGGDKVSFETRFVYLNLRWSFDDPQYWNSTYCSHCHRFLRGKTSGRCPACRTPIQGSPIPENCETCGYNLTGLRETRCPERGTSFEAQDWGPGNDRSDGEEACASGDEKAPPSS